MLLLPDLIFWPVEHLGLHANRARYTLRMKLKASIRAELEAGVSQARLAQMAEVSAASVRGYEKDGLIPTQSREGKKTYGLNALEALQRIKQLRREGLGRPEIVAKLKGVPAEEITVATVPAAETVTAPAAEQTKPASPLDPETEAALRARVEQLRAQLEQERSKLAQLAQHMETRVVQRRNELVLTKKELEELERLREANIRRAVGVTRRTTALRYATTRKGVILFDPKNPKKK
jgi:DNA-binding transcriptional MerR regulator